MGFLANFSLGMTGGAFLLAVITVLSDRVLSYFLYLSNKRGGTK